MRRKQCFLATLCAVVGAVWLGAAPVGASSLSTTTLVTGGLDGRGVSAHTSAEAAGAFSSDGRFLVYASSAANLVPNDSNGAQDIFIYDRLAKKAERVSVGNNGAQADGPSYKPSISDDGKYVVFTTQAGNLHPDSGPNCVALGCFNIILHNRSTGQNTLVNRNTLGLRISVVSLDAQISGNGGFVVFSTQNPVNGNDTNGEGDVVVRALAANVTTPVSVDGAGSTGPHGAFAPTVSRDGRFVTFTTRSSLLPDDTNGLSDVYLRDRQTAVVRIMNVADNGSRASQDSFGGVISADGKSVAFLSQASNLVPNDTNAKTDLFVRDWQAHTTRRVNVANNGTQANEGMLYPASISGDGKYVVFTSYASNLVGADTNGTSDVFIRYRDYGITRRVDLASHNGPVANAGASLQAVSADGKAIAFSSTANNLAPINPSALNIFLTYNPVVDIPYYDPNDFLDLL